MIDDAENAAAEASDRPRWLRDTVLFLGGQTVSLLGSMLVQYAVFWYLTIEYKSGSIMALAAIFGFLPQALVSVFGGVWADRHNRKLLIIGADAAIAVSTLALALVMMSGYDAVWLIFLTMAVRSAGAGIQMPAVSAIVPQIVPTRHLIRVNGLNGSIQSTMALVAPAAAGAIYAWASASLSSAVGALIPIFFIDVVDRGDRHRAHRAHPGHRRAAHRRRAARLLRRSRRRGALRRAPRLRALAALLLFAIVFLLAVAPSNLTPLMAVRSFDAGAQQNVVNLAVLEIMFSVGMILGGVLVATVFAKRSRIGLIITSSLLCRRARDRARPVPEHLGVLRLHVPRRDHGPVLHDLLDDAPPGDGRARAPGPGLRLRRHRDGGRDADRDGGARAHSPTRCRSSGFSSEPACSLFVVVGAAVGLPAGRRAVAAAQAASHDQRPRRRRRGSGRRSHHASPGFALGSDRAADRPAHPRERLGATRAPRPRNTPPNSPRRRRDSSTPGTPPCRRRKACPTRSTAA